MVCRVDSLAAQFSHIKLIAGLGNPGLKYQNTRHNLGFRLVDHLARLYKVELLSVDSELSAGYGTINDRSAVWLLKPQGYMNRSGPPIDAFLKQQCISSKEILVIYDDIDLMFGRLKIKTKGGDGGHRGVKSLIGALKTGEFSRLRLGIGRSEANNDVVNHVLGQFDGREMKHLANFVDRASEAVVAVLESGVNPAMNRFNRKSRMQS